MFSQFFVKSLNVAATGNIFSGNNHAATTSNVTRYFVMSGESAVTASPELDQIMILPFSGTLKSFYIRATNNSYDADTIFTIVKNGSDTSITVTVAAAATTLVSDLVNKVSFAAGDTVSIKLDSTASSTGQISDISFGIRYV